MDSLGAVVACGGETLADSSKCWAFDGSSWTSLTDSTQHHGNKDSLNLIVDSSLFVTGRLQNSEGSCVNEWTSEIFTGEKWQQGPAHPTGY